MSCRLSAQRMKADCTVDDRQTDAGVFIFSHFIAASEKYIVKMGIILESNHNSILDGLKFR